MWKSAFLCSLLYVLYSTAICWAATYYLDATNGNNSNAGTSEVSPWKTISKVNSSQFQPGDFILFKRGEMWREQLIVPSSGVPGNPITFGAYGSGNYPIITTKNMLSGWSGSENWTDEGNNVWGFTLARYPYRLWISGTEYVESDAQGNINSTERWWYDSGILYVYAPSNPASLYYNIEGAYTSSANTIEIPGHMRVSYITFTDLDVRGGQRAIMIENASNYNIIKNSNIGKYSGQIGVFISHSDYNEIKDNVIDSATIDIVSIKHNTALKDGVMIWVNSDFNQVYNNTITDWGHAGVNIECTDAGGSTTYNEAYQNTITASKSNYCRGFVLSGNITGRCAYNKIYRNRIDSTNLWNQIHGDHNKFYYNIITNVSESAVQPVFGCGIAMFASTTICHDNEVYNNVVYNTDDHGIWIGGAAGWRDKENNLFENNIVMNWGIDRYGLFMDDHESIKRNTYRNNIFYKSGVSNVVKYRGVAITISKFNGEHGNKNDVIENNIQSNPLFTNPSIGDFTLQSSSPAINAGTDVGLTQDFSGVPVPQGKSIDIGAFELQKLNPPKNLKIILHSQE